MVTNDQALEKLRQFLEQLQRQSHKEPIDIEAEWPPSDDGLLLIACTGWVTSPRPTRVADHFLEASAWGGGDIEPDALFRLMATASGPRVGSDTDGPPIYVRLHDSAWSVVLRSGQEIWDQDRPVRIPPPMRPIQQVEGAPPVDPTDSIELRRGHSIARARAIVEASWAVPIDEYLRLLLAHGIRVTLDDDGNTIQTVTYIRPFPRKMCGVWLGASAWQVQQILGPPVDEFTLGPGNRAWTYHLEGHLGIAFDEQDRVTEITR
jgi:hypothetical protein